MSKILELAKKLHALAERGENHERENAADKLQRLMDKYNISFDDIDSDKLQEFELLYPGIDKKFVVQIIANVCGKKVPLWSDGTKRKAFLIECSHTDFLLIQAKIEFFWKVYQEELGIFYRAFLQANDLTVKSSNDRDLTPEEIAELKLVLAMMSGMRQHKMERFLTA
jgi:hypothetical protein